jgi:hypothetical protein
VARCIDSFRTFAKQVFRHSGSAITRLWNAIFADGIHDAKTLEEALIEQFGPKIRMFGYSPTLPSGHKVAVVATTTTKASPVVFANYNGTGTRPKDGGTYRSSSRAQRCLRNLGYKFVRPSEAGHEPSVWQA